MCRRNVWSLGGRWEALSSIHFHIAGTLWKLLESSTKTGSICGYLWIHSTSFHNNSILFAPIRYLFVQNKICPSHSRSLGFRLLRSKSARRCTQHLKLFAWEGLIDCGPDIVITQDHSRLLAWRRTHVLNHALKSAVQNFEVYAADRAKSGPPHTPPPLEHLAIAGLHGMLLRSYMVLYGFIMSYHILIYLALSLWSLWVPQATWFWNQPGKELIILSYIILYYLTLFSSPRNFHALSVFFR